MLLHFLSWLQYDPGPCYWKSTFNSMQLALMLFLLLIISGSVHPNPGPAPSPPVTSLTLCHVNMRSLQPDDRSLKLDELHSTLCVNNNFDVICISETWLDDSISDDDIALPEYQVHRRDRNRHGGGVAIYTNNSLPVKYLDDFNIDGIELVCVEIKFNAKSILIACCYRPPGSRADAQEFLDNFQLIVNLMFVHSPDSIFILGDFNDRCIYWEDNHSNSELGLKFRDLIENNIMFQIIRDPTYITPNYRSLLDLVITDSPGYVLDSGVATPIGDPFHCFIYCKLSIQYSKDVKYEREIWQYNKCDFQQLNLALLDCPWDVMDVFEDIDDMTDYFTTLYTETCKQFIPFKKVVVCPQDKPWMNNLVKQKLKCRNMWHKRWKRSGREHDLDIYRQKRLDANETMKQAKATHFQQIKNRLCSPNVGNKEYWKLIKILYGSKIDSGIPSIIEGDAVYSTSKSKCEIFNQHFANKSSLPENLPNLPPLHVCHSTLLNIALSEEDVLKTLRTLNVSKATGPGNVSNMLLKNTSASIVTPLTKLFRHSLDLGQFPSQWKNANVTPVFKKNNKQDKNNYRPISLLPNLGKVFERVVFNHLYKYCQDNNLLTWRNSGYKPLDSSINQLIFISHKIYKSLEKGEDVCFVSLDASSAFDRVWHEGLFFKLKRKGICGKLFDWFKSYLTDRFQKVVIKGQFSKLVNLLAGVPQGSILGPLLFLIYIDDIIDDIEIDILLFADDTSLLETISNPLLSFEKINRDLTKLYLWSNQWLVTFNPTKTAYIIFSKKLVKQNYPDLYLNGEKLKQVLTHKQLGVTFNSAMTFDNHIRENCKKSNELHHSIKKNPRKATLTK